MSESPSTTPSGAITVTREPVGMAARRVKRARASGLAWRTRSARVSSCSSRPAVARRASSASTANWSRAWRRYTPATSVVTATKPTRVSVSFTAMRRRTSSTSRFSTASHDSVDRMTAGRERNDLLTLALALPLVPLIWWLLLGWSPGHAIGGHDELASLHNLLSIREIVETGEGWRALVYRPDVMGGFKGRDTGGAFPLFPLLAMLGLTATTISVVSAFVVQALLAFLGCRATEDLTALGNDAPQPLPLIGRIGVIALCGFAPILGWRLAYGHFNLVVGLLPFAAALALVAAAAARTLTLTVTVLGAVAFVLGLLHSGQQLVVYGAILGAPILLGLCLSRGGEWARLVAPLLIAVGAFLVALPAFWGALAHARSSDAARSLGTTIVTYDFSTATLGDWVTSLPWTSTLPAPGRAPSLHHEVNYPVGPLVVLLALLPWRRARALAIGLAVAIVGLLVLSMDLAPLSRAMLVA